MTRADREDDRRGRRHQQERPLPEDDRVESGLSDKEREAERAMDQRPARHERAQKRAERDDRDGHRQDHPDPPGDLQWKRGERKERKEDPRHVVIDIRVGLLRPELDRRIHVARRVPGIAADQNRPRSGPEAGEVILVHHLEASAERPEQCDEEDAGQDRDEERRIRAACAAHVAGDATWR